MRVLWNAVNTSTIGPKYFGRYWRCQRQKNWPRYNGVVVWRGFSVGAEFTKKITYEKPPTMSFAYKNTEKSSIKKTSTPWNRMHALTLSAYDRKDYYGIGNFKVKMFLGVFKIVLGGQKWETVYHYSKRWLLSTVVTHIGHALVSKQNERKRQQK